jgi:hypothetical protein
MPISVTLRFNRDRIFLSCPFPREKRGIEAVSNVAAVAIEHGNEMMIGWVMG